jgi:hypothetical protein
MKPRNKLEREVVTLSAHLPVLSLTQENWAKRKLIQIEDAYKRSSRITASAFLIVTTFKGWQVIRYYMMYTKVAYHKAKKNMVRRMFSALVERWKICVPFKT